MAKNKYKLPKKPNYKKHPNKPKKPKGGIKTEAQLKAYENKVSDYQKKCSDIDKINKGLKSEYDKKVAEVEKLKKADLKAKADFKKRLENAEKKLKSCRV